MIHEIDLFGVYVSPIAVLVLSAWGTVFALRLALTRLDAFRFVWHLALLMFSVYAAVLSFALLAGAAFL